MFVTLKPSSTHNGYVYFDLENLFGHESKILITQMTVLYMGNPSDVEECEFAVSYVGESYNRLLTKTRLSYLFTETMSPDLFHIPIYKFLMKQECGTEILVLYHLFENTFDPNLVVLSVSYRFLTDEDIINEEMDLECLKSLDRESEYPIFYKPGYSTIVESCRLSQTGKLVSLCRDLENKICITQDDSQISIKLTSRKMYEDHEWYLYKYYPVGSEEIMCEVLEELPLTHNLYFSHY